MIAQFDGLEINQLHNGDAWKICDLVVANEARLKRYFQTILLQNLNPTLSQLYVEQKLKEFNDRDEFVFTVKNTKTRQLIGIIGIKETNWIIKQAEFYYCIDYNFERKGITSKSVKALCKYAFEVLGLEILQIIAHKENVSSIKVAEKCGFQWIKTLKNEFIPTGEQPIDMELYQKNDER